MPFYSSTNNYKNYAKRIQQGSWKAHSKPIKRTTSPKFQGLFIKFGGPREASPQCSGIRYQWQIPICSRFLNYDKATYSYKLRYLIHRIPNTRHVYYLCGKHLILTDLTSGLVFLYSSIYMLNPKNTLVTIDCEIL